MWCEMCVCVVLTRWLWMSVNMCGMIVCVVCLWVEMDWTHIRWLSLSVVSKNHHCTVPANSMMMSGMCHPLSAADPLSADKRFCRPIRHLAADKGPSTNACLNQVLWKWNSVKNAVGLSCVRRFKGALPWLVFPAEHRGLYRKLVNFPS